MSESRKFRYDENAKHDHIVVTVTNNDVAISFNKNRYNIKQTMACDSGSQFSVSIQEPITQKIWDLIERRCPSVDCLDCEDDCIIKELRGLVK